MKQFVVCILAFFLCAAAGRADQNDSSPIKYNFGIAPFSSAPKLIKTHRPLVDHLIAELNAQVIPYTSIDHERFLQEGINGRFHIVTTPAHFAPFFADAGFTPIVKYKNALDFIFIVHKDGAISKIGDLKGKRVGLTDYLSLYYVVGLRWIDDHKDKIGGDYTIVREPSHAAAIASVAAKKIDATITGTPPYLIAEAEFRAQTKSLIFDPIELPSLITMAHSSLGAEAIEDIRRALYSFAKTDKGKAFFKSLNYGGYVKANEKDIRLARETYAPFVEELLKAKR
ncbi:MAG: phosphate/phosphite/phosphonate ABC transporter substrate-binding protein [Helicobacteraceae bacterium]|nr:phosphate/phosphite/phosphonate ABC transporter substrate-binding protein [Helicobacteraceae bacterium]